MAECVARNRRGPSKYLQTEMTRLGKVAKDLGIEIRFECQGEVVRFLPQSKSDVDDLEAPLAVGNDARNAEDVVSERLR